MACDLSIPSLVLTTLPTYQLLREDIKEILVSVIVI